jgi:hypothetical protein
MSILSRESWNNLTGNAKAQPWVSESQYGYSESWNLDASPRRTHLSNGPGRPRPEIGERLRVR